MLPFLFLLVLFLMFGVAAAMGFLTGWLGGRHGLPVLNMVFTLLALGPAVYCVFGNVEALTQVARELPQLAGALGRMRLEILVLAGLLIVGTLWASLRRPYTAAVTLGLLYPVAAVSASAFGVDDVSVAERLNLEFDGRSNFALFLACALGTLALVGVGAGQTAAQKSLARSGLPT